MKRSIITAAALALSLALPLQVYAAAGGSGASGGASGGASEGATGGQGGAQSPGGTKPSGAAMNGMKSSAGADSKMGGDRDKPRSTGNGCNPANPPGADTQPGCNTPVRQ